MARGSKKNGDGVGAAPEVNPEATEQKRLKKLALRNNMLSESAAKPLSALSPSKTVLKHHGKDIRKKSHRKNRCLFSLPGLLGHISGGKIGELKDLTTRNPILYLDFPQGQMKLFGTIVHPKNGYLTLQFSRGGKNVICDEYFDNMIIFSDAWWIGRKDENPDEARLEFPKEINEGLNNHEFKGGAGVVPEVKLACNNKSAMQNVEELSTSSDSEDEPFTPEQNLITSEATPVRQSTRTAGKKFNFTEGSSEDGSEKDEDELSEEEVEKLAGVNMASQLKIVDSQDAIPNDPQEKQEFTLHISKNISEPSMTGSPDLPSTSHGSLVQATISTLFKKAESKTSTKKPASPKASSLKLQKTNTKKPQAGGPRKKAKVIDERNVGTQSIKKAKNSKDSPSVEPINVSKRKTKTSDAHTASALVEEEDIEEFSCSSKDDDDDEDEDEDEDWAG